MKHFLSAAAIFGFVGGLLSIIAFVTFYYSNFSPLLNLNSFILEILLTILFIFLSVYYYKMHFNSGELRFWQGMTVGFFTYVFMSGSLYVYLLIFLGYVEPGAINAYIEDSLIYLENSEVKREGLISEEEFLLRKKELMNVNAHQLALSASVKKLIIGLLITPVASIILRK
jgi:hypothetical protein